MIVELPDVVFVTAHDDIALAAFVYTRGVSGLWLDFAGALGLLALMLLIDARRPARTDGDGELIPLAEQDRSLWDRALVAAQLVERLEVILLGSGEAASTLDLVDH